MRAKIIGVGKCGCRICYDTFAYVSGLPNSFEIRTRKTKEKGIVKNIEKIRRGIDELKMKYRIFVHENFGSLLIADAPEFITLDTDLKNNEILSWVEYITVDNEKIPFPGKQLPFSFRNTGCDHHVVSENEANQWNFDPLVWANLDEMDILAVTFSIGGGTGGGAGPVIIKKAIEKSERPFIVGVGILPESDEPLMQANYTPKFAEHEKYSTGRYFVNFLGKRLVEEKYSNSCTWVIGNDLLRLAKESVAVNDRTQDPNISMVNSFFSKSITMLCNSSSKSTISESNLDSQELKNRMNNSVVISGYSEVTPESSSNDQGIYWTVKELVVGSIRSRVFKNGENAFFGLSIPICDSEILPITDLIKGQYTKKFEDLSDLINNVNVPIEIQTTQELIILYGQSKSSYSGMKGKILQTTFSKIFSNSNISYYLYKHEDSVDQVLIFLINPFVRLIQNTIYYYLSRSFVDGKSKVDYSEKLDELLLEAKFDEKRVTKFLLDNELLLTEDVGESTIKDHEKFSSPLPFEKETVIHALKSLHKKLHWTNKPIRKSRIIKAPPK